MAVKSPLALVKEKFGDKEKLVQALEKLTAEDLWVARTNKEKGLAHVSNSKLLRLFALFTEVKEKFGTREKLIDALLALDSRPKDQGLRQRYAAWPVPRLYDAYRSTAKRHATAKAAAAKAAAPAAKPAAKKAPATKAKAPRAKAPATKAAKAKKASKAK
jgi:hypothetical protein